MKVPPGGGAARQTHKNNQINQAKELLILPGCGCYRLPGLGGGHRTAKSAEESQETRSDARPSRRPQLPLGAGVGPTG